MVYDATICPIPKPVSEEHITQYIRIRLAALKTNPQAFGSTFAGESAFSHEQWCARIDNPARTTFFATSALSTDASLEGDYHEHDQNAHAPKWIGTLSLLGPDMLRSVPFPPSVTEDREDAEIYMLTGMWVDPGFRKKGVGKQLVEHALQAVRGNCGRKRVLVLEVNDANVGAQKLYEGHGFAVRPGGTKDSRKWMALNIN